MDVKAKWLLRFICIMVRSGMEFHPRCAWNLQLLIDISCRKSCILFQLTMKSTIKVLVTHDFEQIVIWGQKKKDSGQSFRLATAAYSHNHLWGEDSLVSFIHLFLSQLNNSHHHVPCLSAPRQHITTILFILH